MESKISVWVKKHFGCIMESKISVWAEINGKRAYGQVGFRKHHSTIDHLVTLQLLMEESRLKGKGLYCWFVDFKKTFDMVPGEHFWRRMEKLEVPSEYILVISRIYEKVICCVRMRDRISFFQ